MMHDDDDNVDGDGGELVSPPQKNAGGDYDYDTNNHDDGDSSLSTPQTRFVPLCRQWRSVNETYCSLSYAAT